MGLWMEMEIGITGGEEDEVDNTDVDEDKLYTSPEQVWKTKPLVPFLKCFLLPLRSAMFMECTIPET